MSRYKKIIGLIIGVILLSTIVFTGIANAKSIKTGNNISVAAGETVNSMLFAAGDNIDIAGTVIGDIYCAGQTITISGTVNGDVICAGQTIVISGKVDGSVRLAGQNVTISNMIDSSATIAAQELIIDKNGTIGRDLLGGSQNVTINGTINRDVMIGSSRLTVNGQIDRDINGGIETLSVGPTGIINGNVEYISNNDPSISYGGKIKGSVTRTLPEKNANSYGASIVAFAVGWFIYILIAMIAFALMLVGLFPRVFKEATTNASKALGKTALVGFIACIATPFLIMVLIMSIIGIPLAILATLVWIVIMMLSGPFTAYLLGRKLMPNSKKPIWIMALGVISLVIVHFIPILGFIAFIATSIFGTGMILMEGKKLLQRSTK
jgi:cytoskeletal protein CcmA (bactofilin family)